MKLRNYLLIFCLPFFGCKCQLEKDFKPTVYHTMKMSKDNGAFVSELKPELPFINMAGNYYYIDQAWVERSHFRKNFRDVPAKDLCLVINFRHDKYYFEDLHSYVKEAGNSMYSVWRYLDENENDKDTLVINYRKTKDSVNKNIVFMFFRQK